MTNNGMTLRNETRIRLLGVPIDNLSFRESIERIEQFIATRQPHQHVVINVNKLMSARKNPELLQIIESCHLINVDGQPVVWASRILGQPLKERVTGIQLMIELLRLSQARRYRPYLLGARREVLAAAIRKIKSEYPCLQLAGWRDGYWQPAEESQIVAAIRESGADMLFVGISSPRKEHFLRAHLQELGVPFVMGVGGSFDVLAGFISRAPLWMQRSGMEWFWRLAQEPRRMWRRYLLEDSAFPWLVIQELARSRRSAVSTTAALPRADK